MNFENGIFSSMLLHYDVDKIKSYVRAFQQFVCTLQTVWKFQSFSVTQILCEIKVGESEASTIAILYYEALVLWISTLCAG